MPLPRARHVMQSSSENQTGVLESLLDNLRIPVEYQALELESGPLLRWKDVAWQSLNKLQAVEPETLVASVRSRFLLRVTSLIGVDDFTSQSTSDLAKNIADKCVSHQPTSCQSIVREVLETEINPLFIASAHPRVNLDSGRSLPRPAGGTAATQDFYREQHWKNEGLGCWNCLRWCIMQLDDGDFETLWPLVIPPLMTLVDDFDPRFKPRGIAVATELVDRVDASLLKRTGVDSLLFQFLGTAMRFLSEETAPPLFLASTTCYLRLTNRIAEPGSQRRYELLWTLISEDIIGGAWIYGTRNAKMIETSVEALIPVVDELGISSVRFFKALIPQLSEFMITKPEVPTAPRLQLLSCRCLTGLIRICAGTGLVGSWKHRILDSLLRCWVETKEKRSEDATLVTALLELARELVAVSPDIHDKELPRLMQADPSMFSDLFPKKS
ncbi:hypothetical protein DL93DRAFT_2102035 [Clavulina sp. PMI_390]|nr:hypothetical protein DL93DRAFT_2102035 [Clavulina sp. PMI_390]